MADKKTTVIVAVSHETNNDIVRELAELNKEKSKQAGGYVTKTQLLSQLIEEHYGNRRTR